MTRPELQLVEGNFGRTVGLFLLDKMQEYIDRCGQAVGSLIFGQSPTEIYDTWLENPRRVDWSRVFFANADEYIGPSDVDPRSAAHHLLKVIHPLQRHGLNWNHVRLLDGAARHPRREIAAHVAWIGDHGGLDLSLLGLGVGPRWSHYKRLRALLGHGRLLSIIAGLTSSIHFAFNETLSSPYSRGRVVRLHLATRRRNRVPFPRAMTLGLQTLVLDARSVVVVAKRGKRSATDLMVNGPQTSLVPASAIQLRQGATWVFVNRHAYPTP